MTLKLSTSNEFKEIKQNWINAVQNGEQEKATELYDQLLDQLMIEATNAGEKGAEQYAASTTADGKLNAETRKFYNEINKEVGFKEEKLLPQETIDEIFDDLTTDHELLSAIGVRNAGLRLKFLRAETSGVAVWGKIFGEIKGQLDAAFSEEEAIDSKLTAFVVIPKDAKEFGPAWIQRFVTLQIQEAFATALELAFLTGSGKDQPVGLNRKVAKGTSVTDGAYPEKTAEGTLTFADAVATVKELTGVYKYHSVKENGKPLNVSGEVVMVVNPEDAWDVKTQYTHLNANGVYVTALPYNLKIVESVAQAKGKVLTFVPERYDAYLGGGVSIRRYDETLALEDMHLYCAKQFAYGKAKDDKAAAVWTLDIQEVVAP